MAFPGIFRVDPPPVQATPHVPIGTQAQQPPPVGNLRDPDVLFGSGLWPPMDWPAQVSPRIAAQTLTYGDSPPPLANQRDPDLLFGAGLWPPMDWPAQAAPRIAATTQPVLFVQPAYTPASVYTAIRSWSVDWPAQARPQIAPETLTYGDQPPLLANQRDPDILFGSGLWPSTDWPAQASPRIAASIQVVALVQPAYAPTSTFTAIRSWNVDWPAQARPTVVSPAFLYGLQPPVGNQRDPDLLFGAGLWPLADWSAQRRPVVSSPAIVYGQQPPPLGNQRDPDILFGSGLWPFFSWSAQSAAPAAIIAQPLLIPCPPFVVVMRVPAYVVTMTAAGDGLLMLDCESYLLVDRDNGLLLGATDLPDQEVCMSVTVQEVLMRCPE